MDEGQDPFEMAKALYPFKATIPKTLSFKEGDSFLVYQQSTKQRNWWQVIDKKAQVGYVPSNYVTSVKVSGDYVAHFVLDCIAVLRKESDSCESGLSNDREDLLVKLLERRDLLEEDRDHVPVPPDFQETPTTLSAASSLSQICLPPVNPTPYVQAVRVVQSSPEMHRELKKEPEKPKPKPSPNKPQPKPKPQTDAVTEKKKVVSPTSPAMVHELKRLSISATPDEVLSMNLSRKNSSHEGDLISEETVYQLVEQVRCHTELSHEMSRIAVSVVLNGLKRFLPQSSILRKMSLVLQGPMNVPQPLIEHTHDAKRLHVIFSELTSCKDDAQQRSWMLHEDEDVIIDYVKELTSILMNADASICRHVINSDQYSGVLALAQYYQMEVRWSIRQPLLQALGVLCSLDRSIVSIFLSSVLPMELARDMRANKTNIPKLNYSALLLTMIFSMGEAMPITHLEHLGVEFMEFILENIELPPETDTDDQIPDLFVTLVLSYNLQFKTVNDNVMLKGVAARTAAKTFTEKILLLLNREDDPVRIFEHEPAPPHSVLKLFVDLFSNTTTASLFYTNDVKVLIDIIVRQLADLSPGDQRRNQYLSLCRVVMRNSGYSEHHHRKDDLLRSFTRIFCEETEVSLKDQQLVREISNEFPQYFKS